MLISYYDLSGAPPTYDIVAFLSHVEAERIRRREDKVQINILPGPAGGFRSDNFWPRDLDTRRLMLNRVALPMAGMLPSADVYCLDKRPPMPEPNSIGWGRPPYGLAVHVKALRAGIRPLREQKVEWGNKPLVTITLREAEHWPQRNSNLAEWIEAYHQIKALGFDVVVIRDTAKCEEPLPEGVGTNHRAAWQLNQRAILYNSAVANLGVNNGPLWMAIALDAPVLMFKPTVESHASSTKSYFQRCGIPVGGQYPNAPAHHRIVWAEDTAAVIVEAFKEFVAVLELASSA